MPADVKTRVHYTGSVDMIMRMFPPFPIPGFAPNFTGYDLHEQNINWYDIYESMAQAPKAAVYWVSIDTSLCAQKRKLEQVAQLLQRNRAAPWVSFGWVVDDGVGQ